MPIYDIFSSRKKESIGDAEDVYQYDDIPKKLRSQAKKIIVDGLGMTRRYSGGDWVYNAAYQHVHDVFCRESGIDFLTDRKDIQRGLFDFIDSCQTDEFLDIFELSLRLIDGFIRRQSEYDRSIWNRSHDADDLINETNYRFRQSSVGYQFVSGNIIRQDSAFAHDEIVKPALSLLHVQGFSGPEEEYLTAHRHYRLGNYKEAITEAAKAFESMMKAICDRKGWSYPSRARASDLVKVLRSNSLWPTYMDGSFDQLIATLTSGLPQVRNDSGAHGQGALPNEVPVYVAEYALNLAAAKIILLAEAAK